MAVIVVLGIGCRSVTNIAEYDRLRNFPAEVSAGDIIHVTTGEKITFSQLADSLEEAGIVYVGESHTNAESHELQLQVLKEFYRKYGDKLAVGMEMFKRPYQDVLDKWTRGAISEKDLLYSTDWEQEWGYDYGYYKDIMSFTRDNHIPVIALNIKRDFQGRISRDGIEGLSDEDRNALPEIDTTDRYHRRYLERIFKSHGHAGMGDAFERFYTVQCVWEDFMADSISDYVSSPQGKDKKFLVFLGGGHILYHFGVPKRVFRRNHLPYFTVYTYELRDIKPDDEHPLFARDIPLQPADYVKVINVSGPVEGKVALGVMIRNISNEKAEETENAEKEYKVVIDSVLPESPAGKAGLQAGDIILSMDDEGVSRVYDVIYHVRQKKQGDTCRMIILRGGENVPVEITFFALKAHGRNKH